MSSLLFSLLFYVNKIHHNKHAMISLLIYDPDNAYDSTAPPENHIIDEDIDW